MTPHVYGLATGHSVDVAEALRKQHLEVWSCDEARTWRQACLLRVSSARQTKDPIDKARASNICVHVACC